MGKKNVNNILSVYNQATADEIRQGLEWYQVARNLSALLHPDISVATGIVAAISPGLRVERNIEAAKRIIVGESIDGLGIRYTANLRKAYRILHGESPEIVLYEKKRSGQKVRNFWRCILNPKDWFSVCVDGHAFAIWAGERIALDDTPNLSRGKRYESIAMDYTRAADSVGILPMQLQAITWVTWRRIHGVANGGVGHIGD